MFKNLITAVLILFVLVGFSIYFLNLFSKNEKTNSEISEILERMPDRITFIFSSECPEINVDNDSIEYVLTYEYEVVIENKDEFQNLYFQHIYSLDSLGKLDLPEYRHTIPADPYFDFSSKEYKAWVCSMFLVVDDILYYYEDISQDWYVPIIFMPVPSKEENLSGKIFFEDSQYINNCVRLNMTISIAVAPKSRNYFQESL